MKRSGTSHATSAKAKPSSTSTRILELRADLTREVKRLDVVELKQVLEIVVEGPFVSGELDAADTAIARALGKLASLWKHAEWLGDHVAFDGKKAPDSIRRTISVETAEHVFAGMSALVDAAEAVKGARESSRDRRAAEVSRG